MSFLSPRPPSAPPDDLSLLLDILPQPLQTLLLKHPQREDLIEVVMDLGRIPEARFPRGAVDLGTLPITQGDLRYSISRVGHFSSDNRAGIERTLHRISALRNRNDEIIGLTCRVGRAVFGTIKLIQDLVETGESLLLLGRPGVGKTTALREIARVLADDLQKRVVIIDTSNEIAGDGDIPHPAIGRARRMQVARPELQHQVMIEAVENHMPEVIVIDEIGTELEALAARTIAERGVQLVGTAHGNRLENLIKNPTLADLVGGIQAVTLGDEEARRRGSQKTVLERKAMPTFTIAVEMLERQKWVIHAKVAQTIDTLLRGKEPGQEIRAINPEGEIEVSQIAAPEPVLPTLDALTQATRPQGLRASGRMAPLAPLTAPESWLEPAWVEATPKGEKARTPGPNGEDLPVYVYPYGVGRAQLEQVITVLNLPIVLTKDLQHADAVLALRSHLKHHPKLKSLVQEHDLPIYSLKSNSLAQISRTLKQILGLDDPKQPEAMDLRLFTRGDEGDELEALEEARLAVEQIVIPTGQPVELLPRNAKVRKMQHELVEHYRLHSDSLGEEPHRRLRIYPA